MMFNDLMRHQLESIRWDDVEKTAPPDELNEIANQGFVKLFNCFLSKKLLNHCGTINTEFFEDEIALECFVNSIHIDDYVSENYLQHSIVFCNLMIKKWNEHQQERLNIIIILDDETLLPTIKFHLKRKGVSWLDEDKLDSSIQAVLVTTDEIESSKLSNLLIK